MTARMYEVTAASQNVGAADTTGAAWGLLAGMVEEYLRILNEGSRTKELIHIEQEWRFFGDSLRARSLTPWVTADTIDGPDELRWGVEKRE